MQGFTCQDWESINTIISEGRMVSKFLQPSDYFSKNGVHYQIPFAQYTDYGSTPKAVWGAPLFLIPYGWWSLPTVGHDSGYQNTLLIVNPDGTTKLANLAKQECDDLLLEMMQSIKPTPTEFEKLQMEAIYHGVCIGGWHAFKEDRS